MTPAPNQPRESDGDRVDWRERFFKQIDEDPAQYLDQPLFIGDDGDPADFIAARMRGLNRINRVNAWIAVEHRLDRGP